MLNSARNRPIPFHAFPGSGKYLVWLLGDGILWWMINTWRETQKLLHLEKTSPCIKPGNFFSESFCLSLAVFVWGLKVITRCLKYPATKSVYREADFLQSTVFYILLSFFTRGVVQLLSFAEKKCVSLKSLLLWPCIVLSHSKVKFTSLLWF